MPTDSPTAPAPTASAPPASSEVPRPLAPLDGAVVDASAVPFSWRGVPGATGYRLQVAASPDFAGDVLEVNAGETTALTLYGALPVRETELVWRVRAEGIPGEAAWSGYGRFVASHDDAVEAYQNERDVERTEAAKDAARRREAAEANLDLIPHYEREESVTTAGEASTLLLMLVTFALTIWLLFALT
ncbi:MAG: hypothetical protein ABJF88_17910 [Rhodothermales bacterium]